MKHTFLSTLVLAILILPAMAQDGTNQHPIISVWPPTIYFGSVVMGDSVTNSFTVKNVGGARLKGEAGWAGWMHSPLGTFDLRGGQYDLAPNQSQTVNVIYSPSGATDDSTAIVFGGDFRFTAAIAWVSGSRLGTNVMPKPVISVTPTNLDFGTVKRGVTVTNQFTIRNIGGGVLQGTAAVGFDVAHMQEMLISIPTNHHNTRDNGPSFNAVSGATYSLGSNESQVVTITYTPNYTARDYGTAYFAGSGRGVVPVTVTMTGKLETP